MPRFSILNMLPALTAYGFAHPACDPLIMTYRDVPPALVALPPRSLGALVLLLILAVSLTAQTKPLSGSQLDDYLKSLLAEYYTGKMVYAKVAIPATERGLQIVDGRLEAASASVAQSAVAQPGTALVIRQLTFKSKNIEVRFEGSETAGDKSAAPPSEAQRLTKSSGPSSAPRLNLRFSRAITTSDLTIPNINRLLSAAVDIGPLIPKTAEPDPNVAATPPPKRPDVAMLAERAAHAQGISTATVIADLTGASPEVGELTIECATAQARVYIDGNYSGWTPRTIKLLAGIHSILIVSDGYTMWEEKFFILGGKASRVSVELKRSSL